MNARLTIFAVVLCLGAGPALADRDKGESGGKGRGAEKRAEKEDRKRAKEEEKRLSYFHRSGHTKLKIPKGHYPPPGMCRAWYPDRPPGHQPPPQRCDAAIPAGAWLIEHPRDQRGRVRVTAYEWQSYVPPPPPPPPTVIYREAPPPRPVFVAPPVLAVGEFNIADGVLVRVIVR